MSRFEQLALDLGPGTRRGPRWRPPGQRHPWRAAGRLAVSLLVALALAGVAVSLTPYRSSLAQVGVEVRGSVTPAHRGLTVDSSLGDLRFRSVTALPLGLHVTPHVDLAAVRAATGGEDFPERVRADLQAQAPALVRHFAAAGALGLLAGALAGGLLFDGAVLLVAAAPSRPDSRRRRLAGTGLRTLALTVAVVVTGAGVTAATYRPDWYTRYTVTGLLADVAATPARLATLDARDSGAAAKVRAVLRLQDALTQPAQQRVAPSSAYNIMFISDVHRRNIYPYLQQYVDAHDVALIVDTGDETLVGNPAELTPDYLAGIRAVTSRTPMVWVKGNHDSAAVAQVMDALPGVTVLDGQVLSAYGLRIYGTADPRTYGAPGELGSDDPAVVTRVETAAAKAALSGLHRDTSLDLLLAHEPEQADAMTAVLGPSVRAQASGHVHAQNAERDLQARGRPIRLVEGSTGLGGLLADAGDPMELSVLSVAEDCQYTRVVRYQLADPALPTPGGSSSFGDDSSFVVHYFDRQPVASGRQCSRALGVREPVAAAAPLSATLAAARSPAVRTPTASPAPPPAPGRVAEGRARPGG